MEAEHRSTSIQDAHDLFNMDDDDIEMIPVRRSATHRSADHHSSDEARPPTSESDATGLNTSFNNDEDDEHDSDHNDPLLQGNLRKVRRLPPPLFQLTS